MKKITLFSLFTLLIFSVSSCAVIGDIFKAGVWVGILLVAAVIALVIFIIAKISG